MTFTERLLEVARGELGCKETSTNNSPCILKYHQRMQKKEVISNFQWCCEFVYWVYDETCKDFGVNNQLFRSPSTIQMLANSTKFKIDGVPAVGSIFVYSRKGGGHTGIVETYDGGNNFGAIEGNASDMVRRVNRKLDDGKIWRFIHVEDGKEGSLVNGLSNYWVSLTLIGIGGYYSYKNRIVLKKYLNKF